MKQAAYDMLYLTACAVNGIKPEKNIIKAMDMDKLFEICQFHSLTSIVCMALESTGIKPSHKWIETKAKAIRKVMLHDVERQNIISFMEENGIWYMPLKGVILKELYPKSGMRQMTDNDILYDETYQHELRNFMVGRGYSESLPHSFQRRQCCLSVWQAALCRLMHWTMVFIQQHLPLIMHIPIRVLLKTAVEKAQRYSVSL